MHMGMVGQGRPPGMQHQREADVGSQMFGITGDDPQGLGGSPEQDVIDHGFVLVGDIADRGRQREDQVVVLHRQQVVLACLQPAPGGGALALGAVPVAAGVVGDLELCAVLAAQHMAAQFRAAAAFDGGHDLELAQAQVPGLRFTPCSTLDTEDIRDLQRVGHEPGRAINKSWEEFSHSLVTNSTFAGVYPTPQKQKLTSAEEI